MVSPLAIAATARLPLARLVLVACACAGLVLGVAPGVAAAAPPTIVSTAPPFTSAPDTVQVSVQVNPGSLPTTAVFDYGATTNYGSVEPPSGSLSAGSGSTPTTVTTSISGLTPGQVYHFQPVVSNAAYNGVTGPDQSFIAGAPNAVTGAAAAVNGSNSSETVYGTVNPGGSANGCDTTYYFTYGPAQGVQSALSLDVAPALSGGSLPTVSFNTSSLQQTQSVDVGTAAGTQSVQATLSGLAPGTYQYTLEAVNCWGTVDGATNTFTVGLAQATTGSATQIASGGALLNGQVNPTSVATTFHFEYGLTTSYGTKSTETLVGSGNSFVPVQATLSGLFPGSTYHYRVVATTAAGETDGADATFTLQQTFADTTAATAVTPTSATLNGLLGDGGLPTNYYFDYGTTTSYGSQTATTAAAASGSPLNESAAISGLTAGVTYHYRLVGVGQQSGTAFYGQDQTVTPGQPQVLSYGAVTPLSDSSVTLDSQINPGGLPTTVQYEIGTSPGNYTTTVVADSNANGASSVDEPWTLTSLTPGTLYYYRVVASNIAGVANGAEQTFTAPDAPSVSVSAPLGLVATAAALQGSVTSHGYNGTYHFVYATDAYYTAHGSTYNQQTTAVAYPGAGSAQAVQAQLTGLSRSTTYHFALIADDGLPADLATSADSTFTTPSTSVVPAVSSPTATNVQDSKATIQATLNPEGQDTTYYFEYGTGACTSPPTPVPVDGGAGSLDEVESVSLSGLSPDTVYHFCLVATNASGTTTGPQGTFTTLTAPSATTGAASQVKVTTVTLAGTANPNGFATSYYFEYGTTVAYGQSTTPQSIGAGTSPVAASAALANLVGSTTYHYRLVATNGVDVVDGADATFTTSAAPKPPALTDPGPSGVDDCDATINANINPEGQATTWSVVYGTTTGYGTTVAVGSVGSGAAATGNSPVAVSVSLSNVVPPCTTNPGLLTPDTQYHYAILAQNATGITTEADHTFTTFTPPTASTGAPTAPGASTVNLGANVNPNGFATTYSFQYGPTAAYGSTTSSVSAGAGTSSQSVVLALGGLHPLTTYHFRVVATNGPDTVYGNDATFATGAPAPPSASTETTSSATATGITLGALVNPLGQATTYTFEYGLDASYGSTTVPQSIGNGNLPALATAVLSGLTPGTIYHYRVVATSASGTTVGADATFTTPSLSSGGSGGAAGGGAGGSTSGGSTGSGSGSGSTGGTSSGGSTGSGSGSGSGGGSHGGSSAPTLTVVASPSEKILAGLVTLDTGVRVSCPKGGPACSVSIPVTYLVAKAVAAKKKKGKPTLRKVATPLMNGTLSVPAGGSLEATVPVSPQAASVVLKAKRLAATASVSASVSGGSLQTKSVAVTLTPQKAPVKKKKKH